MYHGPYHVYGKYGVALDVFFCFADTSGSKFESGPISFIAGDVRLDKDGAGLVNHASPSVVTAPLFKIALSAADMQANVANVVIEDQGGSPQYSSIHIMVETRLQLGAFDVDATQIGGNAHAMTLTGVGTGYGLFAKGSSGIRAEAQGTAGHGLVAAGIGSGQGIEAAKGASGKVCNFWDTLEGPEPAVGPPADNASFGTIQQFLKRRHTNKVTQDSSTQTWYRDNSTDVLTSRTVSDDLVTQVQNKLT